MYILFTIEDTLTLLQVKIYIINKHTTNKLSTVLRNEVVHNRYNVYVCMYIFNKIIFFLTILDVCVTDRPNGKYV